MQEADWAKVAADAAAELCGIALTEEVTEPEEIPEEAAEPEELTEEDTEPEEMTEEDTESAEAPENGQALPLALPAEAAYTVELPDAVALEIGATVFAMKVDILRLAEGDKLRVTVASQNDYHLTDGSASLPYTLAGLDGVYTESTVDELTVTCGDPSSLPAGTYADTLTFAFAVQTAESAQ